MAQPCKACSSTRRGEKPRACRVHVGLSRRLRHALGGGAVRPALTRRLPSHRYDRADTIGQNLPIYVQTSTGFVNATDSGAWEARVEMPSVELKTPATVEELSLFAAQEQDSSSLAAFALLDDPMLWAVALTGLQPSELVCLEGNEGA